MSSSSKTGFGPLGLSDEILSAISKVGYENPSPIQSVTIPFLLAGRDLLGQAQTGTGKTAAFALPALSNLDLENKHPQVLVLTPTRELTIQVSEAFQKYAAGLSGFKVLPIYGGQDYSIQLRSLKRGVHVIVGTPGRVIDHIRRKTLKLENLNQLVLDEADEMLKMGFIDDVEWVLQSLPKKPQITLFSATMPSAIRSIAEKYLENPEHVKIEAKTATAETVRQRYWIARKIYKLDALTRILEAEPFDAALIFVRTKSATIELAERLKARGFSVAPLNGDIPQAQREKTVALLKKGVLDILVATDVAARGLDVQRISHVINYDIPFGTEAYVHRIGRTGRAGRKGDAILFISPREQRMLRTIEKATRSKIEPMDLPSTKSIAKKRREEFKKQIDESLRKKDDLGIYVSLILEYVHDNEVSIERVAAALAKLSQGDRSLDEKEIRAALPDEVSPAPRRGQDKNQKDRKPKHGRKRASKKRASEKGPLKSSEGPSKGPSEDGKPKKAKKKKKEREKKKGSYLSKKSGGNLKKAKNISPKSPSKKPRTSKAKKKTKL